MQLFRRFLEASKLWLWPETAVVMIGRTAPEEALLYHASLHNTLHLIYLVLDNLTHLRSPVKTWLRRGTFKKGNAFPEQYKGNIGRNSQCMIGIWLINFWGAMQTFSSPLPPRALAQQMAKTSNFQEKQANVSQRLHVTGRQHILKHAALDVYLESVFGYQMGSGNYYFFILVQALSDKIFTKSLVVQTCINISVQNIQKGSRSVHIKVTCSYNVRNTNSIFQHSSHHQWFSQRFKRHQRLIHIQNIIHLTRTSGGLSNFHNTTRNNSPLITTALVAQQLIYK